MITLSVQVRNAKLMKKALEDLNAEIPQIASGRIWGRMQSAKTHLMRYPPQSHKKMNFVSDKQRRWFFWALRSGQITVPYQRTRNYAQGWKIEKTPSRGVRSIGYSLINRVPYTKHVGGDAYGTGQARYHQGNWPLIRDIVDNAFRDLPKEIEQNITMAARRRGL